MSNSFFKAICVSVLLLSFGASVLAKGDDFESVVKLIERYYNVKHQSIPLLARAGMKAATTAARIKGGEYKRIAEAGSVKVAFFQDQEFDSRGNISSFRTALVNAIGPTWSPLVETLAPREEEQTYVFIRLAGEKFNMLVVTLGRHEGTVVQVNVNPHTLALLMQSPDDMGKAITDDATQNDN